MIRARVFKSGCGCGDHDRLRLQDGSLLDGEILSISRESAQIRIESGETKVMSLEEISAVLFMGRVTGQIMKEMPKRLANTVWIPGMWSHGYTSMASNNDVWASAVNSLGLGFKAVGVGIWRGISFPFR